MLEQDLILQRSVPALDLALGLRVIRPASRVVHVLLGKLLCQISRDVGRSVV
jgi:hypothetical protein